MLRALVAGIVTLVFGAMPLAADCCAISCLAPHAVSSTAAATDAMPGMPECDHSAHGRIRISQNTDPCGHHGGVVMVAEAVPQRALASPASAIGTAAAWSITDVRPDRRGTRTFAEPAPNLQSHRHSFSLRI